MASNSGYSTDGAIHTKASQDCSMVHDLYGLVGVLKPNATETEIRDAYEAMAMEILPHEPSNAVSTC